MKKLLRFACVGFIGFLTDAGLLAFILNATAVGPLTARLVTITAAMIVTWMFNRVFTFGKSRHPIAVEGVRYGSIGVTVAFFNYALYSLLLITIPVLQPLAAVVLATTASMFLSFFGYSRYVFDRG